MSKLLLSLWIAGAALFSANTLIILGWPSGEPRISAGSAHKEAMEPKETMQVQSEGAAATDVAPAVRLEPNIARPVDEQPGQQIAGQVAPNTPRAEHAVAPSAQDQAPLVSAVPQDDPGEWVKVSTRGANVRSGPASSASRLATLSPGGELRVVAREDGWVQVASLDGSQTGWIYERLLEPIAVSPQGSAQPGGTGQDAQQGEMVRVARPGAKVLAGPSDEAAMLFGFPEGRELRVLSRQPGWVQIVDPESKQPGWIAESALAPAEAGQQQAASRQRPSRGAPYDAAENAGSDDAWMLGDEGAEPADEIAEPPRRARKWERRGRFAGGLRRALRGAF